MVFGGAWVLLADSKSEVKGGVEAAAIVNEPTPTPTPPLASATPQALRAGTPTPRSKPLTTPVPSPMPVVKFTPGEIYELVNKYAAQYGIDPNVMRHIAICESGFDPLAVNGPYVGLFQFGAVTWKNNRLAMGKDADLRLRLNAEEAVQTAAYLLTQRGGSPWPNCYPK